MHASGFRREVSAQIGLSSLTHRQVQCLQLAADGLSSPAIGRQLGLSPRTVDDHIAAACRQFGVRTRVQAVALGLMLQVVAVATTPMPLQPTNDPIPVEGLAEKD